MGDSLITLAQYKASVGITSTNQDVRINALIPRVSEFVKNYCGKTFIDYVFTSKVEVFNGDTLTLILKEEPVLAVSEVSYSTDYGQTYTALVKYTDWVDDDNQIRPISSVEFAKKILGYKVTYTAGYDELPEDLIRATIDLVSYYLRNDGTVNAVKSVNSASKQIEYISNASLPSYIRRILDNYITEVS